MTGSADPRLLAALRHAVDTVLVMDAAGVIQAVSPSAPAIFGYDPEVVAGMDAVDLVHPDDVRITVDALGKTVAGTGRMEPLDLRIQDGWGRWRPVTVVAVNRLDDPEVRGIVLTVRDETGSAELARELAERDDRYRQIVELAAQGVWSFDAEGRTTLVTARMASMLGYTESEMLGRHLFHFMEPERRAEAVRQQERRKLGITEEFEFGFRHRDGHAVHTRVSITPVMGRDGTYEGAIAMITDVTALQRERERIHRAEATHLAMLRAAPDTVFRISADGTYLEVHANDDTDLAVPPDQTIGHRVDELFEADLAARFMAVIGAALDSGGVQRMEYTLELDDGPAEFEARVAPITDGEVVVVVRNVSDLRAAEEARRLLAVEVEQRRAEDRIRAERERTARMESLGRLAGGVAHDINNVLGVIGNYAGALAQVSRDPETLADVRAIEDAVRRGSDLTQRLLTLGRGEQPGTSRVDLRDLVEQMAPTLHRVAPDRDVRVVVPAGSCPVQVDGGRIEQALVNLVANAADATGPGGAIEVVLDRHPDGGGAAAVRLSVRDHGTGMTPEVLERAFEPYFTTKGPDRGTGLGLAVVHGAVSDAGGSVRVEQPADGGTVVVLELPALGDPPAVPTAGAGGGDHAPTVLVVDDDPDALRSVARLLETCGFRVVVTTSGAEAVARLRDTDDVDVVLTDVVMPQMSGPVLTAHLRALRPALPVVLMTAYGADLLADVDAPVLSKPLVLEEVDRVLRRAVGRAAAVPGARPA